MQKIEVQHALATAECEYLPEDDVFYCEIPNLPGVWASGPTEQLAREQLHEVLLDWIQAERWLDHAPPGLETPDVDNHPA
jgi:predicted RNase H-like HicB family nuclease